jgi:uncharacterized protein YbcV (DUF1398 family)
MESQWIEIARENLTAAYAGSKNFPAIVQSLSAAGFESYTIDYRRHTATYYRADGDSVELATEASDSPVAAAFQAELVAQAVRAAQANAPGYTYRGFCEQVKAAGCAGYMVSFLGRRVVYQGRTGETHVEHFPT